MKSILVLILAATFLPCHAQSAKVAPRYTGAQLLEHWSLPPGAHSNIDRSASNFAGYRAAKGYMDAVNDATEGRDWCFAGRIKPDELDADVFWALKKLPPDALKRNAAELIVDVLRAKYPCAK